MKSAANLRNFGPIASILAALSQKIRPLFASWQLVLSFAGILLTAILFRTIATDRIPGINGDEALDAVQISDMLAGRPTVFLMPTGRLLSPIYGAVLVVLEKLLPVSFWTVRAPAMLSGVLSIFLAFFLLKRLYGWRIGFVAAFFVALSPELIAYSRIGIEQTILPLTSLVCLFFALQNRWLATLIAFGISLLVHPICVFMLPFLVGPLIGNILLNSRWSRHAKWTLVVALFTALYLGVLYEVTHLPKNYNFMINPSRFPERLTSLNEMGTFGVHFLQLLNGLAAFEQYTKPLPAPAAHFINCVFGLCAVFLVGFLLYSTWRERKGTELGLTVGLLCTVPGYYLLTGTAAIHPGVTRYALFFIIPFYVVFALSLVRLCTRKLERLDWGLVLFGGLASVLFYFGYFKPLATLTETPHRTYLSGNAEPKQAAFDFIQSHRSKIFVTPIIAEDWWTYWPLRYLSTGSQTTKAFHFGEEVKDRATLQNLLEQGGYAVTFVGGPLARTLANIYPPAALEKKEILGFANQIILQIYWLRPS